MKASFYEPRWLLIVTFFVVGIFLGGLSIYLWLNLDQGNVLKIHGEKGSYRLINPLLAIDSFQNNQFAQNKTLQLKFQSEVEAAKKNGSVSSASLYFRDIEPGSWVGVNEEEAFSPGKLLKIPIMIAYYKLSESDPSVLNKKLTYHIAEAKDSVVSSTLLEEGSAYPVGTLIEQMITRYDDNSANILFDNIDKAALDEVFSDLGINFKEDKETQDFIPLKLYSLFFRILYNATYLNRENSEKALDLLTHGTSGYYGVTGQVPHEIITAHRFGGHQLSPSEGQGYEVYDCGIIYYPSHPYLLCAAARGKDLAQLKKFLENIGGVAYEEVQYKYKEQ